MKHVWNKETRNEDGLFYRVKDWGIENPDDWSKDNFTDIKPPEESLNYVVPCDFIKGVWVLDEDSEEYKTLYQKQREPEYPSTDEIIVALWEKLIENRPKSADALQIKRLAVKKKWPKP